MTGELAGLRTPRIVAIQQIYPAARKPFGHRHAEMPRAPGGMPLEESEDDRAVGHIPHMPHRLVIKCGDLHLGTFREKKEAGAAPEGAAPATKKQKGR
jgi:hypothetical protein